MPKQSTEERKWEIENATNTIKRAEEIKADKGLMQEVKKNLKKEEKTIKKVIKKVNKK